MSDFTTPRISEKRYYEITPKNLTADATVDGLISVPSTYSFKVGQILLFKSSATPDQRVKVQRVISETQFIVIDQSQPVTTNKKLDMSMFLVADTATVQLFESQRPVIDILEIQRQVYEEEPTVALRSHSVDWLGRPYDKTNPMPVALSDGSINIGTVNAELEVQLSHKDNDPNTGDIADSVRIGDGVNELTINPDGSINTNIVFPSGLATEAKQDTQITVLNDINGKIEAENIRQRILKSADRESYITYADFGTKNQRVTKIEYLTSTIPATTASKVIAYTLVGNKYKRDSINWIIT